MAEGFDSWIVQFFCFIQSWKPFGSYAEMRHPAKLRDGIPWDPMDSPILIDVVARQDTRVM